MLYDSIYLSVGRGTYYNIAYLLVCIALILVHFVSRIAIFQWHWRFFAFSVQSEDATLSVVSVVVILLFSLDVSNLYWLYSMIHTYVKYYPKDLENLKLL